jgi:DGQHR domain-containing protein
MKLLPAIYKQLVVRAVRSHQGGYEMFAFFAPGTRLLEIAEVSHLRPSDDGKLTGFQRPEIRAQVRAISEYLSQGSVLFPNAIVLALAPGVKFTAARGSKPQDVDIASDAGTLTIPLHPKRPAAWVVDGQQRTLALAESGTATFPVPVIAFVSGELTVQREQFILVNRARPLPARLIDELLPEVEAPLPRDLSMRKLPSALCTALNDSKESPFFGLVRRPSNPSRVGVIVDSSLTKVMRRSLQDPRGALAAHVSPDGSVDVDAMFAVMVTYWTAVREVFSDAWGLPPDKSRLMHSAGIEAMGILMDQIMTQRTEKDPVNHAAEALNRVKPSCRWTSGVWQNIDRRWNDIQNTRRDVRLLSNLLISLERGKSPA